MSIIPTRNRYQTLGFVVNGILSYLSSKTEVVIQDNLDDNSEYFNLISCPNYYEDKEHLLFEFGQNCNIQKLDGKI